MPIPLAWHVCGCGTDVGNKETVRTHRIRVSKRPTGNPMREPASFTSTAFALRLHGWECPYRAFDGVSVSRIAVLTVFFVAFGAPGIAQQCNPAIDGTYCASQPNSRLDKPVNTGTHSNPSLGGDFFSSVRGSDPATLGAITFQSDGTRCMGLLRRSNCS